MYICSYEMNLFLILGGKRKENIPSPPCYYLLKSETQKKVTENIEFIGSLWKNYTLDFQTPYILYHKKGLNIEFLYIAYGNGPSTEEKTVGD